MRDGGSADTSALINRLKVALEAVSAGVVLAAPDTLAAEVVRLIDDADGAGQTVAVDPRLGGLTADLKARGITAVEAGMEAQQRPSVALADVQVGITLALAAVAESGTVIVGPGDGMEGLLAVLPPHHIVITPADLIEPDLPAALARIAEEVAEAGSRVVLVSGPSRTSDIEVVPVLGVHGPLRLDVIILRPEGKV